MKTKNSPIKIIGAGAAVLCFVVGAIYYLVYSNDEEASRGKTEITGQKIKQTGAPVGLDENSITPEMAEMMNKANAKAAAAAIAEGKTHTDQFHSGKVDDRTGLSGRMQVIEKNMSALRIQMESIAREQNLASNRPTNSAQKGKAIDRYDAYNGIEYQSTDYKNKLEKALEDRIKLIADTRTLDISGTAKAENVASDGFRGSSNSPQTNNGSGFNRFGNNSSAGFTPASGVPADPFNVLAGNAVEVFPINGERMIARVKIALNSVIGGHVMAEIMSGEHQGTILIADSFQVGRNHLLVTFDRFCLQLEEGEKIPRCGRIRAVAIDLDEQVAAIRGKRRGFYGIRLAGATATSLITGVGRAFSSELQGGITVQDGVIVRDRTDVSTKQAIASAGVEVGSNLASIVNEITQREPEVSTEVDIPIGIDILQPGLISLQDPTYASYESGGLGVLGGRSLTNLTGGVSPNLGASIGANINRQVNAVQNQQQQFLQRQAARANNGLPSGVQTTGRNVQIIGNQ